MQYEVRLNGKTIAAYDDADEAIARARSIIQSSADQQPEVIDTETGEPVAPGATKTSREYLSRKIGF